MHWEGMQRRNCWNPSILKKPALARLEKAVARQKAVLGQVSRQSIQAYEKVLEKARFTKNTVAALRGRLGLTREEFAQLVGAHKQAVYLWERGTVPRGEGRVKDANRAIMESYRKTPVPA